MGTELLMNQQEEVNHLLPERGKPSITSRSVTMDCVRNGGCICFAERKTSQLLGNNND